MAFSAGTDAEVYINGYQITAYLRNAGVEVSRDMYDSTTLSHTDRTFVGGLRNGTFNGEGLFDGTPDAVDEALAAAMEHGAECILTYLPAGDGLGNRGKGMDGDESTYSLTSPVDGLTTVTMAIQSSVGSEALQVLHPLGTITATANGTGVDQTAQSLDGGVGYLQVTNVDRTDGDETLTVKVQDSTDNVVFVDLITFAAATGRGAQRVAVTGTVERYVRAQHTLAGASPAGATYSLAFHRN
jgi:hypothetical protein